MALASASTSTNLSVTVAHAITFLTRPLITSHSATAIMKLQLVLEANLTALYAPTWLLKDPLRGSGRRCLTLSPECLPPRVIFNACTAAGIQWHDWISALGNREFNLFVDPGCVSVRYSNNNSLNGKFITVWADEIASPAPVKPFFDPLPQQPHHSKTLAQQLMQDDHEDDQLFDMIAREIDDPTWTTPIDARFPEPARSFSPLSAISAHSRPSSRSSDSSSTFSSSGASSFSTPSSTPSLDSRRHKQSRRERAREGRVFVDTSKTEVTPYDGGKTTVLTGGVMLGGLRAAKTNKVPKHSTEAATSWRSIV